MERGSEFRWPALPGCVFFEDDQVSDFFTIGEHRRFQEGMDMSSVRRKSKSGMLNGAWSRWRPEALHVPTRFQRQPHCSAADVSTTDRRASAQ